jgi:hypothetical protein
MALTIGPGITVEGGITAGNVTMPVPPAPTNEQITVTSLRKFCRENGLNNGCMSEVATGNRISHKGWQIVSKILYDDTCL